MRRILAVLLLALPCLAQNYTAFNSAPVARNSFLRKQFHVNSKNTFGDATLAAMYPFNEGTVTTQVMDQSGQNNNATWRGTSAGTIGYYSAGKAGPWAGTFNGTDNYAFDGISLNPDTGDFSYMAWFKTTATTNLIGLISKSIAAGTSFRWWLVLNNGSAGVQCGLTWGDASQQATTFSGSTYQDGQWHMAACVMSRAGNLTLYLDGAQQGTPANISTHGAEVVHTSYIVFLGGYPNSTNSGLLANSGLPGSMGGVRIYNRALAAGEISAIYSAGNH